MALTGRQWLEQEIYPKIDALRDSPPAVDEAMVAMRQIMATQMLAGIEALTMTGVLGPAEDEDVRGRLAAVGISKVAGRRQFLSMSAFGVAAAGHSGDEAPAEVTSSPSPDHRLLRVLPAVGELSDDEGATAQITSFEVWTHQLVACVSVAPGPAEQRRTAEEQAAFGEWMRRRRFGEADQRPPAPAPRSRGFLSAAWNLECVAGRVNSVARTGSSTGEGWARMTVAWPNVLADTDREVTIAVDGHAVTFPIH